ncbi:MAG: YeeE/YedE family protein [Chloroflexi bacterium]|nr:YeeE/YedE family protein [Chloroflexota bacterium]
MAAVAGSSRAAIASPWLTGTTPLGLLAVAIAAAAALLLSRNSPSLAVMWLFGLAFGFTLQRARFCFASSFRDLFLLQDGRVAKAIIGGMAVATVGFALVMYNMVPNLASGSLPLNAAVGPVGWHTLLAGTAFGVGMVLAGGCVSGSCYRVGEGYVGSAVALGGIMLGLALLGHTWPWWWDNVVRFQPRVWLPQGLGWGGAVALTLAALAALYLLVLWWESRGGMVVSPRPTAGAPAVSFSERLEEMRRAVLVRAWPVGLAGLGLGTLNVLEYLFSRPLGVTGEIMRWADGLAGLMGLGFSGLMAVGEDLGACALPTSGSLLTEQLMITGGLIAGSLVAALLSREFKLRAPRQGIRYGQSLAGGILMGYAAGLAAGCTLGAFFSAIPALSLGGWVFGLGLALGAVGGVELIKRLS